jgi:hypothetical protein
METHRVRKCERKGRGVASSKLKVEGREAGARKIWNEQVSPPLVFWGSMSKERRCRRECAHVCENKWDRTPCFDMESGRKIAG